MPVQFFFQHNNISLSHRTRLKKFIGQIFRKEKKTLLNLTYIFCSDQYLLKINQSYLKHDYYTDIITFNLSETTGEVSGEIYISIDRVRENAITHGTTIREEAHRVILHGVLHLCGYNDKSKSDKIAMRAKEDYYIDKYLD